MLILFLIILFWLVVAWLAWDLIAGIIRVSAAVIWWLIRWTYIRLHG